MKTKPAESKVLNEQTVTQEMRPEYKRVNSNLTLHVYHNGCPACFSFQVETLSERGKEMERAKERKRDIEVEREIDRERKRPREEEKN